MPCAKLANLLGFLFTLIILVSRHGVHAQTNSTQSEETIIETFLERVKRNGVENVELFDFLLFGIISLLGLEFLSSMVKQFDRVFNLNKIPVRGKHLDDLEPIDTLYVIMNKLATIPFTYYVVKYMYNEPNAMWALSSISLKNTVFTIPPFFIIYDFFYTLLHWGLHIQSIYGYIHKHHHRQKAPSRGNVDAVNVHPVEFFLGEYNHILALFIYCHIFEMEMHILALVLIFVMAAFLTGLNHTRFDTEVEIMGVPLYDSKWHDVHHRIPQSNYGQYINFWDRVFGTFRMYDPNDRVNPNNQLDPKTGKSLKWTGKTKAN